MVLLLVLLVEYASWRRFVRLRIL